MMDRIKGRKDDMKIIKGVNVYPSMIEEEIFNLSSYFTDVYLILYHTVGVMDSVTVNVEVKPGVNKDEAQKDLEKNLREATMLGINVMIFDPGA
ncbi:MAG: hypothetical protein ACTSPS_07310, partial [Promethearchaeota archaeon]